MKGEVKERGMIFNDEMVRAILGGNKTQTRRIVEEKFYGRAVAVELLAKHCPYGQPGDRIWVRETYRVHGKATDVATLVYRASVRNSWTEQTHRVPRILLEITDVRVERLHDMSEADAKAEGASPATYKITPPEAVYRVGFGDIWRGIYGQENWLSNPWVWVIEFKRIQE